jgi:syntaxin 18
MQEARGRARLAREGKRVQVGARNRASGRRHEEEGRKTGKAIMGSTASFRALAPTSASAGLPPSSSSSSSIHLQQQQAPAQAEEEELTPSQLQLFQSESSSLTKSFQADLSALESVTSTLSTISSLQTTLIQHLSTQNETIGALVGEAGEQRVEVKRGNEQLKKARERNRSANRLLGALLVGSGLGLLFLHGELKKSTHMGARGKRADAVTSLPLPCISHGLKRLSLGQRGGITYELRKSRLHVQ